MSGSSRLEDSILHPPLVGFQGIAIYATEAGLVALSIVLPALAHALGIPGAVVLPMHWTVILAAVVLGWKAGALAGLAAPALNTLFTGLPMLPLLPLMTIEVGLYGFIAGVARQKGRLNTFERVERVSVKRNSLVVVVVAVDSVPILDFRRGVRFVSHRN